ncbi:hypothetical protein ACOTTU_13245 [Roseobacter sp. EG26]|uniref:hypothetical protein n=1 Tax=Roseobacter sp. EG26 TaxID=3412477 RepID=UPI0026358141|nr:hypothetical protein [uncultured Roseobacter sp.]
MARETRELTDFQTSPSPQFGGTSILAELLWQTDRLAGFNMEWVIDRLDPPAGRK